MSDSDDSVGEFKDETDKEEIQQYFSVNFAKIISNFQQYCETRT